MAHISIEEHGIDAKFLSISDNLSIEFSDPCYAKAENVLFNPISRAVHAVLHEGVFLVGYAPEALANDFQTAKTIELRADHYAGTSVSLRANLSIATH